MVIALHTLSTVGKSNELSNHRIDPNHSPARASSRKDTRNSIAKTGAHTGWATGYDPVDSRYVAGCGHPIRESVEAIFSSILYSASEMT
jgi:hypothetical protein